jgi:hypothetical protein
MSQRAVEAALGRLITDVEFRVRFFAEPAEVCRENDIVLTAREMTALLHVNAQSLHQLAAHLDPKIVRAAIPAQPRGSAGERAEEGAGARTLRRPTPGLRRE